MLSGEEGPEPAGKAVIPPVSEAKDHPYPPTVAHI